MVDRFNELVSFLEHLEDKEIVYELSKIREGILVEVFTENRIWEIEYVIYPEETRIEIEIFKSDGQIFDSSEIEVLFRDFGEHIKSLPLSLQKVDKYSRDDFFELLKALDKDNIYYGLRRNKNEETILAGVVVPGERWQIEYFTNGSLKIEKYVSDGNILSEKESSNLYNLFC